MYEKTQFGWVIVLTLLIISLMLVVRMVQERGASTMDIGLSIFFVFMLLLFHSLKVKVDDTKLIVKFGIGLIKRTFSLEEITSCNPTEYSWLSGYGIRYRPGRTLYNISGLKAVELSLKNSKRKVLVGSPEPEVLSEFINERITKLE